jgi:hypothetical protein
MLWSRGESKPAMRDQQQKRLQAVGVRQHQLREASRGERKLIGMTMSGAVWILRRPAVGWRGLLREWKSAVVARRMMREVRVHPDGAYGGAETGVQHRDRESYGYGRC